MDGNEQVTQKYLLCVETLKLWGCNENIYNLLSEDLSYRLTEVVEVIFSGETVELVNEILNNFKLIFGTKP